MANIAEIYQTLSLDPQKANEMAFESLKEATDQNQKDDINWARAYALVEMKMFSEARLIWSDIFIRGGSHKALHQVGFVERSEGNFAKALSLFQEEKLMLQDGEPVAVGANLYELAYCNLRLGQVDSAWRYLEEYEQLQFEEVDLTERGCFYRLKGDILATKDITTARTAYLKSQECFLEAGDGVGAKDVYHRVVKIST